METFFAVLALIAIGYGSGFIISFIFEFCLPIVSIKIENRGDFSLVVAILSAAIARFYFGSGFDIKFMIAISLPSFLAYHLCAWMIQKK